jgi:bifunctional DNA-binding transcriptional regulator/antitoxin component of YhaV-PrlF toxin-antitoxin module
MANPGKQQPRYEVITQETEDGDLIIPLPIPLLKKLGWKEGDNVDIDVDKFGKIFLRKSDK